MSTNPVTHVPVAAGAAYADRVRQLPPTFTATIQAEPHNRFNHTAVVVFASGDKIGYLPKDLSQRYFATAAAAIECPARRANPTEYENTGVEILLDLTGVPCAA